MPTIRYYEQIGLLPQPERSSNGHRYYRAEDLKRLTFIKRCRDFGFPIEQVRGLAGLFEDGDRACAEVRNLAQEHLCQVRAKMQEMRELEESLAAFVNKCNSACSGGLIRDCVIFDQITSTGTSTSGCLTTNCGTGAPSGASTTST